MNKALEKLITTKKQRKEELKMKKLKRFVALLLSICCLTVTSVVGSGNIVPYASGDSEPIQIPNIDKL